MGIAAPHAGAGGTAELCAQRHQGGGLQIDVQPLQHLLHQPAALLDIL
jgi:hypothetical protein